MIKRGLAGAAGLALLGTVSATFLGGTVLTLFVLCQIV